ncbi:mandelate racemase/muconate lactonizing enzyme family protein [Catenulispora sp. NF23]|uniref:Mandelate racemase/muconate lactonizing enzyme family protein n=1 Tax=Catenulispora pinistramenti TaxID=2705254 RepID=A0ABS5KM43_9ACTN|nr:mandelate racemase/muconate lactonizing enzyme family protein [Catenulispora pinistramenti]MBS2531703.1 mandelate racemase/muconate lactonizing enzyme family protein [Catenulispora pinistramenti]MBS2547126.1 mandelate racemase/muconate lactonizing enzyme family protein [Catenulispora pinistramenti]
MKITGIEVLTLPDHGDSMMLAVVDTDEGLYGIGEVGVRTRQRAVAGGLDHLAGLLVGEDPTRIEHLWQTMFRRGFYPADRILASAIAAVDVALWDIRGKSLGVPVYELFGGPVRDHIPAYVHVGDIYHDRPAFLDRCRDLVAQGWGHLRFSAPHDEDDVLDQRRCLRASVDLFHAVREAVGEEIELILDVHTRLDPPEAVTLCREIETARPFFVEDPIRCENPDAYRMLRARTGVPLAAGEQFASKWEFARLLDHDLVDYARVDVGIAAGLTEARKIAAMAEARYIRLATHNPLGPVTAASSMHLNAATPNAAIQEHQVDPQPLADALFTLRPRITPGRVELSGAPGLGIDIDRVEARKYQATAAERPQLRTRDGAFTNW